MFGLFTTPLLRLPLCSTFRFASPSWQAFCRSVCSPFDSVPLGCTSRSSPPRPARKKAPSTIIIMELKALLIFTTGQADVLYTSGKYYYSRGFRLRKPRVEVLLKTPYIVSVFRLPITRTGLSVPLSRPSKYSLFGMCFINRAPPISRKDRTIHIPPISGELRLYPCTLQRRFLAPMIR